MADKCNREAFNQRLDFEVTLIPYKGSDGWIDKVIKNLYKCLCADDMPKQGPACPYCQYTDLRLSKGG